MNFLLLLGKLIFGPSSSVLGNAVSLSAVRRLRAFAGVGLLSVLGAGNLLAATPVVSSAATATGQVGVAFSYQITASNTPTSYAATGLPAGLSVSTTTGIISGTPTAAATSSVTIKAINSSGTGSKTLALTVNPAKPAISSVATASGQTGVAFSYQIAASNTPTSFSATGLPSGLSVNTTTGLISGIPTAAATSTVTLGATNAGGTGNKTLTLTVALSKPAITSATTATGQVGTAFSYQITASNTPTSYSATGLPAGLSVSATTGLISGTPTAAATSAVTINAINAAGTGTATLSLTVTVAKPVISSAATASGQTGVAFSYQIAASNTPTSYSAIGLPTGLTVSTTTGLISGAPTAPATSTVTLGATNAGGAGNKTLTLTVTLSKPVITSATTATGQVGTAFSYQIAGSNTPTSFSATGIPAGLSVSTTTGLISGTPTTAATSSVTINAINAAGTGTATLSLTVTVAKPVISSAATASGQTGVAFSYQIAASNTPTSFSATGLPSGLSVNTSTGLISGTPTAAATSTVTLGATNAGGTGNKTLTLTVSLSKPAITSATTATGQVGTAFSYQITASNTPTSYSATGLPAGLSVSTTTGLISGTPTAAATSSVTINAINAAGTGTATLSLTVTVAKPVISSAATASGQTGVVFSYQIAASNTPTSFSATGLPSGLSVNTSTGLISGTPTAAATSTVTLGATNAGGTGNITLMLTVTLSKPAITSATTATGQKGVAFSYQITASNIPTSFSATGLPAGLSVSTTTGLISGTPAAAATSTVSLGATNATGTGNATLSLIITVAKPVITSALTATGQVGSAFTYQIAASNTPTSYSATGLPAGLTVSTSTGKITGTPTAAATSSITLGATNAGGTGNATLSLTVAPKPNLSPVVSITSPPAYSVFDLPTTITITATASDPDGTVSKVEFYKNSTLALNKIGEKLTSPYSIDWTVSAPGAVSLLAVATDNQNATTTSAPVGIQLRPKLPYTADFEASEGYTVGSLDNQLGWVVTAGAAQIVNTTASSGTQSVVLSPGATAARVDQEFGPSATPPPVVYVDFFSKPVAGADSDHGTLYETDVAQLAFVFHGTTGQFAVYDGDGTGGGTWLNLPFPVTTDASHIATDWQRITLRINFVAKTWDLFLNGQLLAPELGFRVDSASALSLFALRGNTTVATGFDDFYVGAASPLFTDTNADGIDDAWETAHGLSLAINQRNLDPDNDGLTNLQEYEHSTDPHNADTDGDGWSDKAEVAMGTDPVTPGNYGPALPVSGARLHLRADLGAVADGAGLLSRWVDVSGHGNDAVQADPALQPRVVPSQIDGLPSVHFSGNQLLQLGDVMAGASSGEIIAVVRVDDKRVRRDWDTNNKLWNFNQNGAGYAEYSPDDPFYYHYNTFGLDDADIGADVPVSLASSFHIFGTTTSPEQCAEYYNGILHHSIEGRAASFSATPNLGAEVFAGDFAEIIVFDRALTVAERDTVGRYLTQKYHPEGIRVPSMPIATAFAVAGTRVDLNWVSSAPQESDSIATIERQTGGGSFVTIATASASGSFCDTGLTAGQTYAYRITLENWAGSSPASDVVSIRTPVLSEPPVDGACLWLRASAGTQGVGLLSRWADQSGRGFEAIQHYPNQQPSVVANQLNGLPVVHFSGNDQWLYLPDIMAGATSGEIIAVVKVNDKTLGGFSDTNNKLWNFGRQGTGYTKDQGTDFPYYHYNVFGLVDDDLGADMSVSSVSNYHIFGTSIGAVQCAEYFNGVLHTSLPGTTAVFSSTPNLGEGVFFGDFAEIIVFPRALTAFERNAVNQYLVQKYLPFSIPIPAKPQLVVCAIPGSLADLSWACPSAASTHTQATVERATGNENYVTVAQLSDQFAFTDTGLTAGQSYTYRVTLNSYTGASPTSDSVTITALDTAGLPTDHLRLWLRSTAVIQGAGPLPRWCDQSGHPDNDAVQVNLEQRPTLVDGQLNGLPVVRFDGVDDLLALPDFMGGAGAGEVFVVTRLQDRSDRINGLLHFGTADATAYQSAFNVIWDDFGTAAVGPQIGPGSAVLAQAHIFNSSVSDDGVSVSRFNGGELLRRTGQSVSFRSDPLLGYDYFGDWYQGDIAEVIVYDRVLSETEREAVNTYLRVKYALGCDADFDHDGLSNYEEQTLGTNPCSADSDGDGIPDGWERAHGLDPKNPADASATAPGGQSYRTLYQAEQGLLDRTAAAALPAGMALVLRTAGNNFHGIRPTGEIAVVTAP